MPFPFQLRRYAQLLTKHLGLLGNVPTVLLEDVQPTFDILTPREDLAFTKQEYRFGAFATSPAVAAQLSRVELGAPLGGSKLLLVEQFHVSSAGDWNWVVGARTAFGAQAAAPIDSRLTTALGATGGAARLLTAAVAGGVVIAAAGFYRPTTGVEGSTTSREQPGVVITPGFALIVEGLTVNTALIASFRWREVPLAPQEGNLA